MTEAGQIGILREKYATLQDIGERMNSGLDSSSREEQNMHQLIPKLLRIYILIKNMFRKWSVSPIRASVPTNLQETKQ